MTTTLRASAFSAFATFLAFGSPQGSFDDGRGAWADYAWQTIEIAQCVDTAGTLACPTYHQKWDWKRNQWVDISISLDPGSGAVTLAQTLTDDDGHDSDFVCVTLLVVNGSGDTIVAHHQNWRMRSGEVRSEGFQYSSSRLNDAQAIHIGSKQCRDGATQDAALYQSVLAAIAP